MIKIILLSRMFSFNILYAQENKLSIFFEAGRASDNNSILGGIKAWHPGPIFRIGAEYELNNSFNAQGFISYSFYKYDGIYGSYGEKTSSVYNSILDIMTVIKWKIGIFYLNLGAGVSHQFNDDIKYLEENQYHKATAFIHSRNKTVFAGQFGLGFEIHIYDRFSILSEGCLFFREYLGSAWLLGAKYSLN